MRVVGATLKMPGADPSAAAAVCDALGIEHVLIDAAEAMQRCVIDYFVASYANGMTPNPCVRCNALVKSPALMQAAERLGFEHVVTGHYARIRRSGAHHHLLRGLDPRRDQSYMLYRLDQDTLRRMQLPLGEMRKPQVRALAAEAKLPAAEREDSQDVCFIFEGDIADLIRHHRPEAVTPGPILDAAGRIIGEHRGLVRYTVGQRRGLGIGGQEEPLFVQRIILEQNALVVGPEESLWIDECRLGEVTFLGDPPSESFAADVATRYRGDETPARVEIAPGELARVRFERPHRAPAPGQSAVFYDAERCLGGGVILAPAG